LPELKKYTISYPWSWPSSPWHRVYIDFAGLFLGKHFFIIVDAQWLEVIPMNIKSAEKTADKLRKLFVTHGLPC